MDAGCLALEQDGDAAGGTYGDVRDLERAYIELGVALDVCKDAVAAA